MSQKTKNRLLVIVWTVGIAVLSVTFYKTYHSDAFSWIVTALVDWFVPFGVGWFVPFGVCWILGGVSNGIMGWDDDEFPPPIEEVKFIACPVINVFWIVIYIWRFFKALWILIR